MRTTYPSWLAVALLCFSGCSAGDQRAEVSGTIRLDGQLVEEGSIQFIPVDGTKGPSAGDIIAKGKYHIPRNKGAAVGKNRVELRAFRKTGKLVQDPTGPPGTKTEERVQAFPPEYNDKPTVFREVEAGGSQFDFDVRTKGKAK